MKRLLLITAFIAVTALYVFSAAWAYDYMSLYVKPAAQTEVRDRVKGGSYAETDRTGFYTSPKETLDKELYDKNVGTARERDYYYVSGAMITTDSRV